MHIQHLPHPQIRYPQVEMGRLHHAQRPHLVHTAVCVPEQDCVGGRLEFNKRRRTGGPDTRDEGGESYR